MNVSPLVRLVALFTMLLLTPASRAQLIYVPKNSEQFDLGSSSYLPMAQSPDPSGQTAWYLGPIRYQQVYDAAEFSSLPDGGAFLAVVYLRLNCLNSHRDPVLHSTNFQLNVSTTPRKPDGLSRTFDENRGPDDLKVYGPAEYLVGGGTRCPSLSGFSGIFLDTAYFYDPKKGACYWNSGTVVDCARAGIRL
jgi:hypothetical protein